MKKFFILFMFVLGTFAFAKTWLVTTTCGKQAYLQMQDDATIDQLKESVVGLNQALCLGQTPKHVIVQL